MRLSPRPLRRVPIAAAALAVLSAATFVFLAASVPANGKVVGSLAERLPDIPRQRALIAHFNGVETLVVESVAEVTASDGDRFAWILPIPAVPAEIEATPANTLERVAEIFAPNIESNMRDGAVGWAIVALLISLWCSSVAMTRDADQRRVWTRITLALSVPVGFFLFNIALAWMKGVQGQVVDSSAVEVIDAKRVGNYETATLRPTTPSGLAGWLRASDYQPLPQEADGVVQAYIGEGWVFLASKLARDAASGDLLAPHPLKVVFPSEAPIFPMRLTGVRVGSAKTLVDLFVASDAPHACVGFETEVRTRFDFESDREGRRLKRYRYGPEAEEANLALDGILPDRGWMTHLRATLGATEMRDDVRPVAIKEGPSYGKTYYTARRARQFMLGTWLGVAALIAPLFGRWARNRTWKKRGRGALIAAGMLVLGAAIHYASLDIVNVRYVQPSAFVGTTYYDEDSVEEETTTAEKAAPSYAPSSKSE